MSDAEGTRQSEEMELQPSAGVVAMLVGFVVFDILLSLAFVGYVVYLALYEIEYWYYVPFAAQFWWGVLACIAVGVFELYVKARVIQASVANGRTTWVPKGEASCLRRNVPERGSSC